MARPDTRIRVLIADRDADARSALAAAIEGGAGLDLVAEAADAEAAVRLALQAKPDVALLDWQIPGGGEEAARQIAAGSPATRVLAFTVADDLEISYDLLHAGALALMAKDAPTAKVLETIRSAVDW